jgi:hypothetical protein
MCVYGLATCRWFPPVSSTNKTDRHDITEILLKVALNIINQNKPSLLLVHEKIEYSCINLMHIPHVSTPRHEQGLNSQRQW